MSPHRDPAPAHAHGHPHGDPHPHPHAHAHPCAEADWEVMATQLENGAELQLPGLRRTAARLAELLGQQGALDALAGALRPGGVLAVAEGGLPTRFLPRDIGLCRPGLQARLDAVLEHWFSVMRDELPGSTPVVEDWPAMLGRAGLTRATGSTYLLDLPAPLGGTARAFVHAQLSRLRETAGDMLDAEDLATLDVLLDPGDRRGVLHRTDAFLLSATTVFTGVRGTAPGA